MKKVLFLSAISAYNSPTKELNYNVWLNNNLYKENQTVGEATMKSLPSLKATSFMIAGFGSGGTFVNNLCNQNPLMFDGCGSFCGHFPMDVQPNTTEVINDWRTALEAKGNSPDGYFKD